MSNKILILVGVPGSGKTTWAKKFQLKNPDWVRVSRDDFRIMLTNTYKVEPKIEMMINQLVMSTIDMSLSKKLNVILDATHLKSNKIKEIVDKYSDMADIGYQHFDIGVKKSIENDKNRDRTVGEDKIREYYESYKIVMDSFNFQEIKKNRNPMYIRPKLGQENDSVIFDIDGTISLLKNRDYDDFNLVHRDDLNHIVSEQIEFHKDKDRTVYLLTGRSEEFRKETEDWLELHEINYDILLMRSKDDHRRDSVIKKEIFKDIIQPKSNVIAVYDDRLSVIRMWNEMGLFVFTVNQGIREF